MFQVSCADPEYIFFASVARFVAYFYLFFQAILAIFMFRGYKRPQRLFEFLWKVCTFLYINLHVNVFVVAMLMLGWCSFFAFNTLYVSCEKCASVSSFL